MSVVVVVVKSHQLCK